jgi:hypothetical protein
MWRNQEARVQLCSSRLAEWQLKHPQRKKVGERCHFWMKGRRALSVTQWAGLGLAGRPENWRLPPKFQTLDLHLDI